MAVLSKLTEFLQGAPNLHTTCAETVHTWEADCNRAWIGAVPNAMAFSLRTYASVYLATLLIGNKGNIKNINWKTFAKDVLRSSVFLSCNLVFYLFFLCRIRHLLGFFSVPTIGYANGIIGSFFAILIEKGSRRGPLALYLTNLASETVFRQLVNHGYLRRIPGGTFIPFSVGLALFKYLSAQGSLDKGLTSAMSFALQDDPKSVNHAVQRYGRQFAKTMPKSYQQFIERLKTECSKTDKCDHDHSCAYNSVKKFSHNFTIGLGISSALAIVGNFGKIITNPSKLLKVLLVKKNFKIPLFFGLTPLIYNSTRCIINRIPRSPVSDTTRDVVSALAAGSAMTAFPNISIAMFTMWKAFEAVYGDLEKKGYVKWHKNGDIWLYAISTGYVLGCAAFEPHAIRSGYIHFLEGLTGNRIKVFNRHHYDYFGAESSHLYGIPTPDFHPGHVGIKIIK